MLGRRLATAGFGLLLIFGFSPLAKWISKPLEDRFAGAAPPAIEAVTHIILLGGFEQAALAEWRGRIATNASGERLLAVALLARRYRKAKVVFSGGHGKLLGDRINAVKSITDYLIGVGVAPARILAEGRSRNTWQNAVFVKQLLDQRKTSCPCGYLLVTSAWHMPRAMGTFRKAGFAAADRRLFAHPVDFRTLGGRDIWLSFGAVYDGLRQMDLAVKEWLGLVAYRLAGRTSALWPGPEPEAGPGQSVVHPIALTYTPGSLTPMPLTASPGRLRAR